MVPAVGDEAAQTIANRCVGIAAADKARAAITAFERDYDAKFPRAVAKMVDDADVLLELYHYPAEHWIHLRATNPIESTFARVRLRSRVTKGPGSRWRSS
jgi:putative transposase